MKYGEKRIEQNQYLIYCRDIHRLGHNKNIFLISLIISFVIYYAVFYFA